MVDWKDRDERRNFLYWWCSKFSYLLIGTHFKQIIITPNFQAISFLFLVGGKVIQTSYINLFLLGGKVIQPSYTSSPTSF